jgi:hypothetical protein
MSPPLSIRLDYSYALASHPSVMKGLNSSYVGKL